MVKEDIELRGKYSPVGSPDDSASPTLRPSLEASYRRSSDYSSDEEDVDESAPLNYDAGTLKRKKDPETRRRKNIKAQAVSGSSKPSWVKRWLKPSRFGCFLLALFFGCVFLLLGIAGFFSYTYKGMLSFSDPFYP